MIKGEKSQRSQDERGATLVIAALILALLTVFVASALINTTSSSISTYNDASSGQAFYGAYAGLEMMTKKFSDFLINSTTLTTDQIQAIKDYKPNIQGMTFVQDLKYLGRVSDGSDGTVQLRNGPYAGLRVLRDAYFFSSTATTSSGVQVQLTRSFYNNLIPIFQFSIFSTRDLEFYPSATFNFSGRVHANGNIYMNASGDLVFTDRVTATGEVVRDLMRNGNNRTTTAIVTVNDPSGVAHYLQNPVGGAKGSGSYTASGSPLGGPQPGSADPLGQPIKTNDNSYFSINILPPLGGQLVIKAPALKLPFQISSLNGGNNKPIELIRRGLPTENPTINPVAAARFYNKPGLRITLSDTQAQLPGGTGGINLASTVDPATGTTYDSRSGYIPKPLGNYQASRINGHRVRGWIKVETVQQNSDGSLTTTDVTEPILALGVTRYEPDSAVTNTDLTDLRNYYSGMLAAPKQLDDRKSVFRLQRYSIPTNSIAQPNQAPISTSSGKLAGDDADTNCAGSSCIKARNHLRRALTGDANTYIPDDFDPSLTPSPPAPHDACAGNNNFDTPAVLLSCNQQLLNNTTGQALLIAYPITMYDVREGRYLDSVGTAVEVRGLFSMIDIDMQNLKTLLTGGFDADFTAGGFTFSSNNIPVTSNGWIIYISDRRGDRYCPTCTGGQNPENGKYDMEAVYGNGYIPQGPPNTETLFKMEDTNDNNNIENDTTGEGGAYNETVDILDAITKGPRHPNSGNRINLTNQLDTSPPALVSLFRRAVRLVNGATTDGKNLSTSPNADGSCSSNPRELCNYRGITVATENPLYIQGNFNTGLPTTFGNPTPLANYPGLEIPAAVVADAVTVLSNNWQDVKSFVFPYYNIVIQRSATNTAYRVAVLAGRPRDGLYVGANDTVRWGTKGSTGAGEPDDVRLYGGVHNFLRYLENWSGKRLFYVGSLIDGWDSWQANGAYKCCTVVYNSPGTRDYTFNTNFRDPRKLPPGTPNLQYVLFTSFRENVNPNLNILNQ